MRLSEFTFELPKELIAVSPRRPRDKCRLLVVDRQSQSFHHTIFAELPRWFKPGDLLVLNDTRVISALLQSEQGVSFLLLEKSPTDPKEWLSLAWPAKKACLTSRFTFRPQKEVHNPGTSLLEATVVEVLSQARRRLRFESAFDVNLFGKVPLPPYIRRRRKELALEVECPSDEADYQTIYAAQPGSVAAPTAGLHFTQELLQQVPHAFLTLHVGPGTFRPIRSENILEHKMEAEPYEISRELSQLAKQSQRIVAVGTTVTRAIESRPGLEPGPGCTDLFIYPPYRFQRVGALLTNFHLPRSTPLLLVSAFAGWDLIRRAYEEAMSKGYFFYSFGDAMLIL